MMSVLDIIQICLRFLDTIAVNEFGLLLSSVCIIAETRVTVWHLL